MPWWVLLTIELIKLVPSILRAVKEDPNPSNKESAKTVVSRIREATVGEPSQIKRL